MQADTDTVRTAYDRLAHRIRDEILAGHLRPGDRLPTGEELCERYQVGRNTAREALRTLASQGLITVKRGVTGGTFVAHPRPEQVTDSLGTSFTLLAGNAQLPVSGLLEIREMLEVPAAELAAFRRTDEDLAELRKCLFDSSVKPSAEVFTRSQAFHSRMIKAARNPWLEIVAAPMYRILEGRFLRERAPAHVWHDGDRDHREILGYLEVGDATGAREASRAHLRSLRGFYERIDPAGEEVDREA